MKDLKIRLSLKLTAIAFVLVGCTHTLQYRRPSEMLLTTDKGTTELFKEITDKLIEHKYKVIKEDTGAGLLVLAPRGFSFDSDGHKITARQTVQMRQEGGSLKLRIVYDCNYAGDKRSFVPCELEDTDAVNKISRVEKGFVDSIRPLLLLHADSNVANTASEPTPATPQAQTPVTTETTRAPASAPQTQSSPANFDDWGDAAR